MRLLPSLGEEAPVFQSANIKIDILSHHALLPRGVMPAAPIAMAS